MPRERRIAYFSMEIALDDALPTYSGGLGVLAGDTIRAAADLRFPLIGVSLLHRRGYVTQEIGADETQIESPTTWDVEKHLEALPARCEVTVEGRQVEVRGWQYVVRGVLGHEIPVVLLDTDLPANDPRDRRLTDHLYGGDERYRLSQEVVLGIGGARMLRAMGHRRIGRYHMNEGHAALLTIELLDRICQGNGMQRPSEKQVEAVRERCIFTTHTPVPAGHDRFPRSLMESVLGPAQTALIEPMCLYEGRFNLTYLALNLSRYVNGVAKRHAEISQHLFTTYEIHAITNGVHAATWTSQPVADLFDRHIPGWRSDPSSLRYAINVPPEELWEAHQVNKSRLIDYTNEVANAQMDEDVLTLGFGRRMTSYKRPMLILNDVSRLRRIGEKCGPLQIIFAGKAHPADDAGRSLVQQLVHSSKSSESAVRVAFLPNYDLCLARLMTSGADIWLNTPQPPLEASGTSGMKAALNGVPSLSVLDGWWLEGCIEGITGWAIADGAGIGEMRDWTAEHASSLYTTIEEVVLPMFYHDLRQFQNIMRQAIALNGSFFNTNRMMQEYGAKAYL